MTTFIIRRILISIPVFIGNKNPLYAGSVGQSIGIPDRACLGDNLQVLRIDDDDVVLPGRRREYPLQLRHRYDAVNAGESVQSPNHGTSLYVEDNELTGIHMGDV